jgi:flagellar biosynthesis protein FlhF
MQVKTFEAFNMRDAVKAIKSELGHHAVILKTIEKEIERDGGKSRVYEVTAAVPESSRTGGASASSRQNSAEMHMVEAKIEGIDIKLSAVIESLPQKNQMSKLESGLEELKILMFEALRNRDDSTLNNMPKYLLDIYTQLQLMGVEESQVIQLMNHLKSLPTPDNAARTVPEAANEYYRAQAIRWMLKRISIAPKWTPVPGVTAVHAFFGPTGTGKTSIIAKLAAQYHKRDKAKVLVVSCDQDRFGSDEQMRVYAKIIGVPFAAISNLEDLEKLLTKHRDTEIVLLDTAGRSPKNADQIKSLEVLKTLNFPVDTHLVLSITEKESQLDRSIRAFSSIGLSTLIFSKLDESWSYGEIYNLCVKWGLPISYFSLGQRIPEDIERASRERVVERIFGL